MMSNQKMSNFVSFLLFGFTLITFESYSNSLVFSDKTKWIWIWKFWKWMGHLNMSCQRVSDLVEGLLFHLNLAMALEIQVLNFIEIVMGLLSD